MTQLQILNGIYTDTSPDIRTAYPVNLIPVPQSSGISTGYLKPADGIVSNGTGPGTDRGGILYKNEVYRVMGTSLVKVSSIGTVTILGDVGGPINTFVTLDYSFDNLAIASGGRLYYWNGTTLTQVTDVDLGLVVDVVFVDGYFMTTDGEFLIVTELSNPTQVNPLKYGSSEADPDPVVALLKVRNEVYALNTNTIEVFQNIGGAFFPFQRIAGAQIQSGCVGTFACCVYMETVAFLGSGRNESPSIFMGINGKANKIATSEIDLELLQYSEAQLAQIKFEARNDKSANHLYVHLPDKTIVYDAVASQAFQTPVWFTLSSSLIGYSQYRAKNFVWAFDKWLIADPTSNTVGYMVSDVGSHYGQQVGWVFNTTITYNKGNGALFQKLELVALTGSVELGKNPQISTSYCYDGQAWSQDRFISVGTTGNRTKRLVWFQQGHMRNWRIQRFRGDSDAHLSWVRLEAQIEALAF